MEIQFLVFSRRECYTKRKFKSWESRGILDRKMKQERVLVAMSGGVDSSMTAALLLEQGYDVIGATMRLSEDSREALSEENNGEMPSSIVDARRVADMLGIPHYVVDFMASFEQTVIGYFLDEYQRGRTPNPCVVCNRHIKFGALLQKAAELGASYIATGHYARVERGADGIYRLRKAQNYAKDQSYVLYHLNQETLAHILFPLGSFSKDETRRMAEEYHLPVAHKAESQEICFVPHDDYKAYLRKKRPASVQHGEIVDQAGNVLGMHEGVSFYTIGQRKGLGIAAPEPLYVTALDPVENRVIVGAADEVYAQELIASHPLWTMWDVLREERTVHAKIRYGKKEATAVVSPYGDDSICVRFAEPQRAVTPGQSVVFYEDDIVLGGGVIDEVIA